MSSVTPDHLLQTLRRADPGLSRFEPLPRIICLDDFDRGFCGWTQLVGNYEGSLDAMLTGYARQTQPMLSTLSHWDSGSHGGVDGSYALKVATRAERGSRNAAIKRLTFRKPGPIRVEAYVTFKPEASELRLSETDVRAFGLVLDLQSGDRVPHAERVMPHLRFLNARDGEHIQAWQSKGARPSFVRLGTENKTVSTDHMIDSGWEDMPGGAQKLCYNEIPTKINWHYLRFDFDIAEMRALAMQCNDRELDVSGFAPIRMPAMRNLWCMLNVVFFIETDTAKRAMLYVDSVCVSGDF